MIERKLVRIEASAAYSSSSRTGDVHADPLPTTVPTTPASPADRGHPGDSLAKGGEGARLSRPGIRDRALNCPPRSGLVGDNRSVQESLCRGAATRHRSTCGPANLAVARQPTSPTASSAAPVRRSGRAGRRWAASWRNLFQARRWQPSRGRPNTLTTPRKGIGNRAASCRCLAVHRALHDGYGRAGGGAKIVCALRPPAIDRQGAIHTEARIGHRTPPLLENSSSIDRSTGSHSSEGRLWERRCVHPWSRCCIRHATFLVCR